MATSTKLRWKRYLNELRYTHEEQELVQDIIKESAPQFQAYCEKFCHNNDIDFESLQKLNNSRLQKLYQRDAIQSTQQNSNLEPNTDSALIPHENHSWEQTINSRANEEYPQQLGDYQMTQDEQEIYDVFNKLFKKVAMVLHPDKLSPHLTEKERTLKLDMFTDSKKSIEERKYFALLDIAESLGITTPRNYKQQIRWMRKELSTWQQASQKNCSTYNYQFAQCETDEQRDNLVMRLLMTIFGPQVFHSKP